MIAPLRICLIEDHPDTAVFVKKYLELVGHVVMTAYTKADGVRLLQETSFDLLLTDIGLPDGESWDLLRTIPSAPLETVTMSGFGGTEYDKLSREAGFSDHLVKPFDAEQLDRILRRVSERVNSGKAAVRIGDQRPGKSDGLSPAE